jgi:carbon monoxide dehydrogenase subunit G
MRVTGEATLHAPVDRVWDALLDPAVLVRTIPGCHRLEAVADDEYRMTVSAGVASIKGTYLGTVRLTEQKQPTSFVLKAAGSGAPGTVQVEVLVTLADDAEGGTRLAYDADAVVGGPVGGVGQRMLTGVARKTAAEFFSAVDDVLTGVAEGPEQVADPPATGDPAPTGTGKAAASDGSAVFTRPASVPAAPAVEPLVLAAAAGAAIALLGAAVGARLARRRG